MTKGVTGRRPKKIAVLGGGPGGLYCGRLLRLLMPSAEVTLYERNPPDATFGFGIGFSSPTLTNLHRADPVTHDAILGASVTWDGMVFRHRGTTVRWPGFGFSGISRMRLLTILQEAAADAGVDMRFGQAVALADLGDADAIIAADGVASAVRDEHAEEFGATTEIGGAKYIWLGAKVALPRTTFHVRTDEAGAFALHSYPYDEAHSTLVVEADEATWTAAGFERHTKEATAPGASDLFSARYIESLFAPDLEHQPVLVNNSKWLDFRTIRNRRWSRGNVVLLGDAAHTAHPSIGSGTKLAMEDAIALAHALAESSSVEDAYREYEAARRPDVERIQERAVRSQRWWATVGMRRDLSAEQLAFSYVTRTGALDHRRVRGLAPALADAVFDALAATSHQAAGDEPLATSLTVRGHVLTSRVARPLTEPPGDGSSPAAGLLLSDAPISDPESDVPVAILISCAEGTLDDAAERVRVARADNDGVIVACRLPDSAVETDDEAAALEFAGALSAAGCDVIEIPFAPDAEARQRGLRLAERLRLTLGVTALGAWAAEELDAARTEVLAGRVDLVRVGSG